MIKETKKKIDNESTMKFFNELYKIGLKAAYYDAFKQYYLNDERTRDNFVFIGPDNGHICLHVINKDNTTKYEEQIKNAIVVFTTDVSCFGTKKDVLAKLESKMTDINKVRYYNALNDNFDVDENLNYSVEDKLKVIYSILPVIVIKYIDEVVNKLYEKYLNSKTHQEMYEKRLKEAYKIALSQRKSDEKKSAKPDIDEIKTVLAAIILSKIL